MGYINLHGTATPRLTIGWSAQVMQQLFGDTVPCSSIQTPHRTYSRRRRDREAAIGMLILQRHLPLPAQDFSLSPRDPALAGAVSSRRRSLWNAR